MIKTIFVTGAGGFIGSEVVRKLYKKYKVIAFVSPYSKSKRLNNLNKTVITIKLDLTDFEKLQRYFKKYKPDYVLHLATHGVYTYQQQDEKRIVVDNYLMTLNLLDLSKQYGVKKFINTGSVFEYGSQNKKVKENEVNLDDILNKYSAVKMGTTALANSYTDSFNVLTIRPFTTYGPDEDETRFIKATINRAINNEPIKLVSGVVRDFVYVEDVANAYSLSLIKKFESGEIVNIGSGNKYTLEEVANLIKKSTSSKSTIEIDKQYIRKRESRCWADISRAKKVLNWSPKYTLLQGIKKVIYCHHNDIKERSSRSK